MTFRRAALATLALGLALVAATASPAAAHASLISIDPADGARLDESPDHVTLTFTEPVSAELGGVRVLDATGATVHQGAARANGAEVQIDLEPNLPDGTYVVSYRVVSADGHPVRGGSVFGVGEATVDADALGRVVAALAALPLVRGCGLPCLSDEQSARRRRTNSSEEDGEAGRRRNARASPLA